jgi:hypothetical protein
MREDKSDWRMLPDGVECVWRSDHGVFVWHVLIFVELLAIDIFILVWLPKRLVGIGISQLLATLFMCGFCAVFTPLFGSSVLRGIRGRGLPSRLRATVGEGVLLWGRINERPKLAVPRDAILDVRVEGDPWSWWSRQWRLVLLLKDGWRARRVLFRSSNRGSLDGTCRALRYGLQLTSDPEPAG